MKTPTRKPLPTASPTTPSPRGSDPVIGQAATAGPGSVAAPSGGDWMAEVTRTPEADAAGGAPVTTRSRRDAPRGRATESRRGHRA